MSITGTDNERHRSGAIGTRAVIAPCKARAAITALSLCSLSAAPWAAAQEAPALAPGTRVRILAPELGDRAVIGTVHALNDKTILLDASGHSEPLAITRDRITRLDVSAGAGSRWPGALIGAAVGGAAGAALGSRSSQYKEDMEGAGAIAGLLVGALVGAVIPPGERWNELPSSRYRISFGPSPTPGLGVMVSLLF
jgi:hypothetical protein